MIKKEKIKKVLEEYNLPIKILELKKAITSSSGKHNQFVDLRKKHLSKKEFGVSF